MLPQRVVLLPKAENSGFSHDDGAVRGRNVYGLGSDASRNSDMDVFGSIAGGVRLVRW
jgi:hypothetical protein